MKEYIYNFPKFGCAIIDVTQKKNGFQSTTKDTIDTIFIEILIFYDEKNHGPIFVEITFFFIRIAKLNRCIHTDDLNLKILIEKWLFKMSVILFIFISLNTQYFCNDIFTLYTEEILSNKPQKAYHCKLKCCRLPFILLAMDEF